MHPSDLLLLLLAAAQVIIGWKETLFIDEVVDRQELRRRAGAKATLVLSAEERAAGLPWHAVILPLEVGRGLLGAVFLPPL